VRDQRVEGLDRALQRGRHLRPGLERRARLGEDLARGRRGALEVREQALALAARIPNVMEPRVRAALAGV